MKSSNPVLARLGQAAERERAGGYAPAGGYPRQPGYGQPYPSADYPTAPAYATPPAVRPMTIDDVVVKTVTLLFLLGISAAAAWVLVPDSLAVAAWIGAAMVGLALGLIISFSRRANPALVIAYSVVEGVFVGMVSKAYNEAYPGIVLQAVVATFAVFFVMAILYRIKAIRATPRFTRMVTAAVAGLFAVMLINFVLALFGVTTGLRGGGNPALAIGFSLVCIVVAALTFIVDFDQVEQGIRMGLPQRYSWTAAFGMVVGLVWLYLEILRLLRYLRN